MAGWVDSRGALWICSLGRNTPGRHPSQTTLKVMQSHALLISVIGACAAVAAALVTAIYAYRAKKAELSSPSNMAAAYSTLVSDLRDEVEALRNQDAERDAEYELIKITAEQARDAEARCLRRLVRMEDEIHMLRAQLRAVGIPIPHPSDRAHPVTDQFPGDSDPTTNSQIDGSGRFG